MSGALIWDEQISLKHGIHKSVDSLPSLFIDSSKWHWIIRVYVTFSWHFLLMEVTMGMWVEQAATSAYKGSEYGRGCRDQNSQRLIIGVISREGWGLWKSIADINEIKLCNGFEDFFVK